MHPSAADPASTSAPTFPASLPAPASWAVGIALGSNLGDRLDHLRQAREAIRNLPGRTPDSPLRCAPVYETAPVGCPPDTPWFLNTVLEIGAHVGPAELLLALQAIEQRLGRPPQRPRNVSRTIDLDLLYVGPAQVNERLRRPLPGGARRQAGQPDPPHLIDGEEPGEGDLVVPHPRLHQRAFVLVPLAVLRPDLRLPGFTRTVAELLAGVDPDQRGSVCRYRDHW